MKADVKSSGSAASMAQPHQDGELGFLLLNLTADEWEEMRPPLCKPTPNQVMFRVIAPTGFDEFLPGIKIVVTPDLPPKHNGFVIAKLAGQSEASSTLRRVLGELSSNLAEERDA